MAYKHTGRQGTAYSCNLTLPGTRGTKTKGIVASPKPRLAKRGIGPNTKSRSK